MATETPGGSVETDARNAYCSILRSAIQRGILRYTPHLLPTFDFLYGPRAVGACFFFQPGSPAPVGSCPLTDGVQQGDVFGPLFFSLGLDELLTRVRERMRDLPVDSTMTGHKVELRVETQCTRIADGAAFYLALDSRVSLVVGPSLSDLSTAPEVERDALLVTLEVHRRDGAGRTIESEFVRVPWRHVRLRAEICLAAYLDDIHLVSELHLLRPFSAILRELGPSVGLYFDSLEKNFIYVPRCFSADCTAAFPDAVIVSDLTPGAGPKEQMREGARALRGDPSKLLISHIGLPKLMGAPLRCLCPGPGLEGDIRWIRDRAHERAREVARLFAHLGLEAVDEEVGRLSPAEHQAQYDEYRLRAALLPQSDPQVKVFLTRHCLGTRLNCVARSLPSDITASTLSGIDDLLVATVAGCAGYSSVDALPAPVRLRATLANRWGGVLAGCHATAPASYVRSVATVERHMVDLSTRLRQEDKEPDVLRLVRSRLEARGPGAPGDVTDEPPVLLLSPLERLLKEDVSRIQSASVDPDFLDLRRRSSRGGDDRLSDISAAEGAGPRGKRGQGSSGGRPGEDPAPAPLVSFQDLKATTSSGKRMGEGLWGSQFLRAYNDGNELERLKLVEGIVKGAGLALLAVPAAAAFHFTEAQFRRLLTEYLGLPGVTTAPWTHHCHSGANSESRVITLDAEGLNHLSVCSNLGRNSAPHNAVRDALFHMVQLCGVTDAAVTESPISLAAGGESLDTDVLYFDPASGKRTILEVSIVTVGSDSSVRGSARRGYDAVTKLLVDREKMKCSGTVARRLIDEEGSSTTFIPFVMSSCGGFGPAATSFLKSVYDQAKASNKWVMASGQPGVDTTWMTTYASTYWDMRLSAACAGTDAHFQNRIILRDRTLNLPVVKRQPHPSPNFAPYAGPMRSNPKGRPYGGG